MDASEAPVRLGKWKRRLMVVLSSVAVVAVCVAIRAIGGRERASADSPAPGAHAGANAPKGTSGSSAPSQQVGGATSSQQPIVAAVNGEEIHRQELANECLAQFGKEVLDTLMNKYLIVTYCEQQNIKVSKQEVDEEIGRLAQKFSIPVDQWLKMLKDERGIKPEQYANDIIWPTLALRKVAASQIQPTAEEINEAYEGRYGSAVRARLIVVDNAEKAKQVAAQARANPTIDAFGALARKVSIDPTSASLDGRIQPIRRHLGDPKVEQIAYQLKDGEISPPIEVAGQFVILMCEGRTEPSNIKLEQVRGQLEEFVRDRKLRTAAGDVFKKLQDESQVVNVYNDSKLRAQMPGVAATINGKSVTIHDLAEACIDRHGEDVVEQLIERKVLEQELKRRRLTVSQQDLDAEIARAAVSAGRVKADGKPNVEAWLKLVVQDQGIAMDKYIHDAVWPSAALKLIAGDVQVSQEDMEYGYQANYGPKAEVRAIVLDNQRRAQDVWQKAQKNPSVEFFGQLAEQYSVEPASRANQGRVPPIRQHGGQPDLEKEAFALHPGEISGVIQVQEKFVILMLEGFTKPLQISREDAKPYIYEDIHEKKLRMKMSNEFDRLKDQARIDNFLAGTSHNPQQRTSSSAGAVGGSKQPSVGGIPNVAIPANYESTGMAPRNSPPAQR
jgi:parvulin-like peptidyl-prolyl isomerase